MMQRIASGNSAPCLRVVPTVAFDPAVLRSRSKTLIVGDCRTNFISTRMRACALVRAIYTRSILSLRAVVTMFLILSDKRDILEWSAAELSFIPKTILLRYFDEYIEILWDKLPEHLRADPEVRSCRRCLEHYNQPWQRTHIDGPAPQIRHCAVCQQSSSTPSEDAAADC
ncbi:uncharacterized protein LOC118645292 [Monomorium pharaonis]|uniref:uncharacterized protein LOC118645292 n=1 Tax=Monomorium pharaonis TaxID=307658 RepID=UPI001746C683|nr:uncharacterized protein LOC118645292 [Monomorium pharaonis]